MSIQVTLNFTSEADLLAFFANKKAVVHPPGLPLESGEFVPAAELNNAKVAAPKPAPTPAAPAPAPKEVAAPVPAAESPSDPKPVADSSAPAAPAVSSVSSAEPVDYPTLQKAVFTLAGKSREAAAAVATGFGVKTFKELDSAKWGEALAAVNAKIAEL
jgi:hypothetical protein